MSILTFDNRSIPITDESAQQQLIFRQPIGPENLANDDWCLAFLQRPTEGSLGPTMIAATSKIVYCLWLDRIMPIGHNVAHVFCRCLGFLWQSSIQIRHTHAEKKQRPLSRLVETGLDWR